MPTTLELFADRKATGEPVMEEVVVEPLGAGRYRLLQSPGFVLGLAADDVFEFEAGGLFSVVQRAGNLCIQLFFSSTNVEEVQTRALALTRELGARLDGKLTQLLVLTIPLVGGDFARIETQLRRLSSEYSDVKWYYGNVYDPKDGVTPLDWWK